MTPAPDLSAHANPVFRLEFLGASDAKALAAVDRAFLEGDWTVFETWAAAVLSGRVQPAKAPPDSPHARSFTRLVGEAPAAERDAVLRFLLRARRIEAGALDPLARHALPEASPAVRTWLLRYLAAFEQPEQAAAGEVLGDRLIRAPRYPDATVVAAVGDLGLVDAAPHLLRFLEAPRRFYRLFTDYTTEPVEVGHLFEASLWALVKLAPSVPGIEKGLADLQKRLSKKPSALGALVPALASGGTPVEPVVVEEHHSYPRGNDRSVGVRDASQDKELSKLPMLALAADLVAGKPGALPARAALRELFPEASWVRRLDVSSALEGRGGKVQIAGGKAWYQQGDALGCVDLATGDLVFEHDVAHGEDAGGVEVNARTFAFGPSGELLVPASVSRKEGKERALVVAFDRDTGEALREVPLSMSGSVRHGPEAFAAAGDAVAVREGGKTWIQGLDGKVRWKPRKDEFGALVAFAAAFAFQNGETLELVSASGQSIFAGPLAQVVGEPGAVFENALLTAGDYLIVLARYTRIWAIDRTGKAAWGFKIDDQWTRPPRAFADAIAMARFKKLFVVGLDGKPRGTFEAGADVQDFLVDGRQAFVIAGRDLLRVDLDTGKSTKILGYPMSGMAHLVGLADGGLVLQVYASGQKRGDVSGYYLLRVPVR